MSANFTDTLYYMLNLRDRERQTAIDQEQANNQALGNASAQAAAMGAAQEQANAARAQQQGQLGIAPGYNDPDLKAAAQMGAAAQQQALASEQRKMQEQQLIEGMRQAGETGRVNLQTGAQERIHAGQQATDKYRTDEQAKWEHERNRRMTDIAEMRATGDPTRGPRALLMTVDKELQQIDTSDRAAEASIIKMNPYDPDRAAALIAERRKQPNTRRDQLIQIKNRVLATMSPADRELLGFGQGTSDQGVPQSPAPMSPAPQSGNPFQPVPSAVPQDPAMELWMRTKQSRLPGAP